MKLLKEILEYIDKHGNVLNHTFSDGTKITNIPLKKFLMDWYNQGVREYKEHGTLNNINAIKKLITK